MDDESLDIEQHDDLLAWLRARGHLAPGESPTFTTLAGGVSNRTVLVHRDGGDDWVLKQALHKLRVEADWFSSPERIAREAAGLRWLARLTPPGSVPAFVFEDPDVHLLAMAAVPQPHANWKQMLLAGELDFDHVRQFAELLAAIHRNARGRRDVADAFADRSFFESLRLEPYYRYSAEQTPAAADFLRDLAERTRAEASTLVHGDFSPKNILVRDGRLVLLDHEVIHWGDPAFDVGFASTHLLSKANHLADRRADFAEAAELFWQTYADAAGRDAETRAVRHTLGCLLARVAGRSPLEYLTPAGRARQLSAAVDLMANPPAAMNELIERFVERLNRADD